MRSDERRTTQANGDLRRRSVNAVGRRHAAFRRVLPFVFAALALAGCKDSLDPSDMPAKVSEPAFALIGPAGSLDAGGDHSCAIGSDGKVACWGANAFGQATVPATLGPATQMSAGGTHTCALASDPGAGGARTSLSRSGRPLCSVPQEAFRVRAPAAPRGLVGCAGTPPTAPPTSRVPTRGARRFGATTPMRPATARTTIPTAARRCFAAALATRATVRTIQFPISGTLFPESTGERRFDIAEPTPRGPPSSKAGGRA
jgi:Regulator of chromosome condensation (RCC1) repeat